MKKTQSIENLLKEYLRDFNISFEDISLIVSKLKHITLKKGETFIRAGDICDRIGILFDGLLMAFYETIDCDIEVSRFFFVPLNTVVTSYDSFIYHRPSNETIKALENSNLLIILKSDLEELYEKVPIMNFIGRNMAELSYLQAIERIHSLKALKANQRIEKLYRDYPILFNKISRKNLSSYIRVNRNLITVFLKSKK